MPPSLVTGKAKVWAQQTADGRFALVYNPSAKTRYPLAVVTGDDGARFADMRIVQGELPVQRYEGRFTDDGDTIEGRWNIRHEGREWEKDFDITYRRLR